MVAGRSPRGHGEKQSSEHQPRAGDELRVEAALEDRRGAREARGEVADVAPGGKIDEEDDPDADQAEDEDDPAKPVATGPPSDQRQRGADQPERDQEVGMGGACRLHSDERGGGGGQAGVAGLPDLDPAVIDELRGDQAARRSEDHAADRPFGSDPGAGTGRGPDRPLPGLQQPPFEQREAAQEKHPDRPKAAPEPPRPALGDRREAARPTRDRRPRPHEQAVDSPIDGHGHGPRPAPGGGGERAYAAPRRCYHRASLRLLFR
jgi:hypothetical protein